MQTNTTPPPLDPARYYPPQAPEMRVVASVQTLNRWRHENRGPNFSRLNGARILYLGRDVLDWIEAQRVQTDDAA